MTSEVSLRKDNLSSSIYRRIESYYHTAKIDHGYLAWKWGLWTETSDIIIYSARKDNQVVGWIIYNPNCSTIEEILVNPQFEREGIESEIIDALIKRETLIAAELLRDDTEKMRWMIDYGFRPTRLFTANGFAMLKMDLSTSVLFERLQGCCPAKAYEKRETVIIEKIPKTQSYDEIKEGLANLIRELGGLPKFIKPGQTVVIKPNIVSDHGLKDDIYKGGIVTDIRLIKALVELVIPIAGKVIIAEGSSINRSETTRLFAHYGYDKLIDLAPDKVSLVDLNADKQIEKMVPGGKRMLSRKIPLTLEKADVIISVPVLKIHFAAIVSLGIKNLQGAVPPLEKYMSHFFGLWQSLVNIHHLVKPVLTIIDGLTGQEDFGPISGTPKKMDLLIGGTNPVAVDSVAMRIMGLDPVESPPILLAYMQGLGPIETEKINIIGPSINEVKSPFKQPVIDMMGGQDVIVHSGNPCPGCSGYLHFVLSKLRKPDPKDQDRLLLNRPLDKKANIFLGPITEKEINPEEINIFMGLCQKHHAERGSYLPGCPPHTEVILDSVFRLFPDVVRPQYANKTEEAKLGNMLKEILGTIQ